MFTFVRFCSIQSDNNARVINVVGLDKTLDIVSVALGWDIPEFHVHTNKQITPKTIKLVTIPFIFVVEAYKDSALFWLEWD
jgi:hypothetical protein